MNMNDTTSTTPDSNTCYLARPGGRIGYDVAGTGPAVVVGNSMGAGSAVIAAAQRPELVSGLVRAGSFVRNPTVSTAQRILLRAAMARPWAALCWKSYLPTSTSTATRSWRALAGRDTRGRSA